MPEQHAVQRESFFGEDRDGVLGVDGQVGQDRYAGLECGASRGPVDALVEVGHLAAALTPTLMTPARLPVLPMPTVISWTNCLVR